MILDCPPKAWKRPAMPTLVKLKVVLRQEGKCAQTGEKLSGVEETIQFDHRPALWERQFDTMAGEHGDTIPPANDPAFIEACTIAGHKVRTHGNGATTAGSDSHRRAKIKRFTEPKEERPTRQIARRPFPTGRKFSSRTSA